MSDRHLFGKNFIIIVENGPHNKEYYVGFADDYPDFIGSYHDANNIPSYIAKNPYPNEETAKAYSQLQNEAKTEENVKIINKMMEEDGLLEQSRLIDNPKDPALIDEFLKIHKSLKKASKWEEAWDLLEQSSNRLAYPPIKINLSK